MKCPNCGGQMGIEDAVCPYCGTPNALATQHRADMNRFDQEYRRTQESVNEKTSFMRSTGGWLTVLVILLVALVIGIVMQVSAWDIGYSMREKAVENSSLEDRRMLDSYLEQGDYGKFVGYYNANELSLNSDDPYYALHSAAYSYVDLISSVSALSDPTDHSFNPTYRSDTCGRLADDVIRIYTIERTYSYDLERNLPSSMIPYLEDIRDRTRAILKSYFGLSEAQIADIPNLSAARLGTMLEEGIAS